MNKLKDLRVRKGISQRDLGVLLSCTDVTVSRYETGQRDIDSETIGRLCDIFGCTADYLLGRSDLPDRELQAGEPELLLAFRRAPDNIQDSIRLLLTPYSEKNSSSETA